MNYHKIILNLLPKDGAQLNKDENVQRRIQELENELQEIKQNAKTEGREPEQEPSVFG